MKPLQLTMQFATACCAALLLTPSANAVTLQWVHQFGTAEDEQFSSVALDGFGNFFAAEQKWANTGPLAGVNDALLHKFDLAGNLLWSRHIGTPNKDDRLDSVWSDDVGSIYVAGGTTGDIGAPNASGPDNTFFYDPYLRKYDAAGNIVWTRQNGTTGNDSFFDIAGDGLGNLYVVGHAGGGLSGNTSNIDSAIVGKYDVDGQLLWMREFGPDAAYTYARSVTPDGLGNVVLAGYTSGSLASPNAGKLDMFISKYDDEGNNLWTRQFGSTDFDQAESVATDSLGNIFVGGHNWREGTTTAYTSDALLTKYDSDGNHVWTRQFGGTGNYTAIEEIASDESGNVFVAGSGGSDVVPLSPFVRKYDSAGNLLSTFGLGTTRTETEGLSWDRHGNLLVAGQTHGSVGGPNAGFRDAWIALLSDPLSGDFNNDGTVDAADYVVWRNGLGTTHTQADYNVWRANFGATIGTAATAPGSAGGSHPAIPEPCTILLTACALVFCTLRTILRAVGSHTNPTENVFCLTTWSMNRSAVAIW